MKYLLIIMLSVFSYGIELSEEAQEGKDIYVEANCQKCHGVDAAYDAKKHKVTNAFELKKWVSSCMTYFGHAWFPEDQRNVEIYLNEIKYKVDLEK